MMKKTMVIAFAVLLSFMLISCSQTKTVNEETNPSQSTPSLQQQGSETAGKQAETKTEQPTETLPKPSTNKTVVTAETAPDVFWAMDTLYHIKDCKELEGKEYNQISWYVVEQIMLRQCPVCNPPQYEGYVENDE